MGISSGLGNALVPTSYGFRNEIINGNFMINQRGYVSGTNLASGAYGFDRWKSNFTNTFLTFTSAPQGQTVTISASGVLHQVIEQANIVAGSYVLSWTGTAVGRVYNSGSTPPSYQSGPLSVMLDGTANVIVEFTPASGTATLGNVQLEFGSRATPFEHRLVGVELSLCQRYYYRTGGNVSGDIYISGFQPANSPVVSTFFHPVPMRATPSLAQRVGTWSLVNSPSQPSLSGVSSTSYHAFINVNPAIGAGNQSSAFTVNSSTYLEFSAEL